MVGGGYRPLRVALMDDDYFALKGKASLLNRDLRTLVTVESESAGGLLTALRAIERDRERPDVVVLDMEFETSQVPEEALVELIGEVRDAAPKAALIGLTQYGAPQLVEAAAGSGARAVYLKADVQLGLATAVYRASRVKFAYTVGVEATLKAKFRYKLDPAGRLERWRIHKDLTPRLQDAAWACIVYGMGSPLAANEFGVGVEAVERYRTEIYEILEGDWYDDSDLESVQHLLVRRMPKSQKKYERQFWGQDWAYHRLTLFPRSSNGW